MNIKLPKEVQDFLEQECNMYHDGQDSYYFSPIFKKNPDGSFEQLTPANTPKRILIFAFESLIINHEPPRP